MSAETVRSHASSTRKSEARYSSYKPGGEVHEIVVFRIADGEDRTIEELLELPDEEVESLVEFKGVLVALPGEEGFNPEAKATQSRSTSRVAMRFSASSHRAQLTKTSKEMGLRMRSSE